MEAFYFIHFCEKTSKLKFFPQKRSIFSKSRGFCPENGKIFFKKEKLFHKWGDLAPKMEENTSD
jgi:hypothetical protein